MNYNIKNPKPTPSMERLRELMDYDPASGLLTWKNHPARKDLSGLPCGGKNKDGYLICGVDGDQYSVHRIIYKWMTGKEPVVMDHINGKPNDNRWHNLRSVTPQENNLNAGLLKNNKSGESGVFFHKGQNRYHANVRIDRKSHHLGSFKTKDEAIAARKAANVLLGFSGRGGKAA